MNDALLGQPTIGVPEYVDGLLGARVQCPVDVDSILLDESAADFAHRPVLFVFIILLDSVVAAMLIK